MKRTFFSAIVLVVMMIIPGSFARAEEKNNFSFQSLSDRTTISGAIEAEAFFSRDVNNAETSDIMLSTIMLGIDTEINPWASGHIAFLWEEDSTEPVDIDEGFIILGDTEAVPVFLKAGKMVVPFGSYGSNMISDPLTLEIGETRESAAMLGLRLTGFHVYLYAFKGDIPSRNESTINSYGAATGYRIENGNLTAAFGADYLSNILDSDNLGDGFLETRAAFIENAAGADPSYELKNHVAGYAVHARIGYGPASLILEHVSAAGNPEYKTDDGIGNRNLLTAEAPRAFHLEGAYRFDLMNREITLAATYQRTGNLAGVLPESRCGGTAGIALTGTLGLSLEYIHDEDYDEKDGGTGESADTCSMKLALTF